MPVAGLGFYIGLFYPLPAPVLTMKSKYEIWYDTKGRGWLDYHAKKETAEARKDFILAHDLEKNYWDKQDARLQRKYERALRKEGVKDAKKWDKEMRKF